MCVFYYHTNLCGHGTTPVGSEPICHPALMPYHEIQHIEVGTNEFCGSCKQLADLSKDEAAQEYPSTFFFQDFARDSASPAEELLLLPLPANPTSYPEPITTTTIASNYYIMPSSSSSRKDKTPTSSNVSKSSSKKDSSSGRTGARRLLKELETWRAEQPEERGIERLGPVSDESLMQWEAVINGHDVGHGYDGGRWLIAIEIPDEYPLKPPKMRFVTQIVHPNIALQNGEICLDLLKDAWTPTYSVLECVRAVRMLLSCPETDSPLNVDVAALLRGGDVVGTRRLVELWCSEDRGRYEGA
ncbi:hypothetical protein NHJ6243_002859 [Beauveria neobassiana]